MSTLPFDCASLTHDVQAALRKLQRLPDDHDFTEEDLDQLGQLSEAARELVDVAGDVMGRQLL